MRCATKSLTIRQSKWLSRTTARRTEARKAARKARKRLTTLLPTRQWRATPTIRRTMPTTLPTIA